MTKYYRLKKDTFMWKEGAIISNNYRNEEGYRAIEDIWDKVPLSTEEYISAHIIENPDNADFFERVYSNSLDKMLFLTAEQLKDVMK
jgi:hypothetical protein